MNATTAAIEAKYSKRTASQLGYKLVQKSSVQCLIDQGIAARSERTQIESDRVLTRLARIADVDPCDFFEDDGRLKPLSEIPEESRKILACLETDDVYDKDEEHLLTRTRKVKLPDRLKALELIGRHLKMFVDRVEVEAQLDVR